MGIVSGILLIVLGGLCVPALVAQRSPKAKELLDKIVPFQGIFGFVIFVCGAWGVISAVLNLAWLGSWPLRWATRLAGDAVNLIGGALLGWSLIQKHLLAKAPADIVAKAEESYRKIASFQPKIGILAIAGGLWVLAYELALQAILKI